jgi:hypothetical protein
MHMLGLSYNVSSVLWEGPPGRSRMWVRQGHWVTPLPLKSATEGALWTWWALSGGFHNFSRELMPTPNYSMDLFPHFRETDIEELQHHPSKTAWQPTQWSGMRHGEQLTDVMGVLYDEHGPVRLSSGGASVFDWADFPALPFGLFWLADSIHSLGPELYQYAVAWRETMTRRDSGEEQE